MVKEKSISHKWYILGFNAALSFIGTQKIEGIINYPVDDIEKMFEDHYLDDLLKELDKKDAEEIRQDWCYIHNEEKDCYNEDGDHDDYHCRKCEINELEPPNYIICGEPFELKQSHFWDTFYLCEKCDKENKLEYSIKCPNCKKSVLELLKSKIGTSIHQEHMRKCNKVFIRFREIAKRGLKSG